MRIAVMGTGGVGGYFGGLLAHAGEDVTFIARGEHLKAIQSAGLRIESVFGDFSVSHVRATDDPANAGPVDLVLLTTKTYQIEAALRAMRPLVGPDTAILPLENGVDAAERAAAVFGQQAVLGGACYVAAFIAAPGVIRQQSQFRRIVVGEMDGQLSARARAIADAVGRTGAIGELSAEIQKVLWTKFIFIAPLGGVGAVTRVPVGEIWACDESRRMLEESMCEVEEVARRLGVRLDTDVVAQTMDFVGKMSPDIMASMERDILTGKPSELEAMIGFMVRKGHEMGVPVPTYRFMYAALLPQERRAAIHK